MKSYTDIEQSKKLAEILKWKTADMTWVNIYDENHTLSDHRIELIPFRFYQGIGLPAWSLAALLEYMNRNFYNISLNYCGSEYTISFDDGERFKTITKDYSIDAAFEMVCWLKENGKL